MILGPDGLPATQLERRAAGFTERTLPVDLGDLATFAPRMGYHEGRWYQRGNQNGWREGWYQEPFARGREGAKDGAAR